MRFRGPGGWLMLPLLALGALHENLVAIESTASMASHPRPELARL